MTPCRSGTLSDAINTGPPIGTAIAGYIGNVAAQRVVGSSAKAGSLVAPGSAIIYRIGVGIGGSTTTSTFGNTGTIGSTTTTSTTLPFPPGPPPPG